MNTTICAPLKSVREQQVYSVLVVFYLFVFLNVNISSHLPLVIMTFAIRSVHIQSFWITLCITGSEIPLGQTAKTNLLVLGFVQYLMLPTSSYYKAPDELEQSQWTPSIWVAFLRLVFGLLWELKPVGTKALLLSLQEVQVHWHCNCTLKILKASLIATKIKARSAGGQASKSLMSL